MGSLMGVGEWLKECGCGLVDLLYPPRCVVCREPGPDRFCLVCRAAIVPPERRVAAGSVLAGRDSVGAYDGPLRQAVLCMKYEDRRTLAFDLGALLAVSLEERREEWRPDGLVPVPIHARRRRERGYNQADLLATGLGRTCSLPVRDALERVRDTPPQVGLGRTRRRDNVRGAFQPRAGIAAGRRPVLIDDVQTSGATLEEAARTLRAAGAHVVYALTLCWEPPATEMWRRATTPR
jgi:ComF family protein